MLRLNNVRLHTQVRCVNPQASKDNTRVLWEESPKRERVRKIWSHKKIRTDLKEVTNYFLKTPKAECLWTSSAVNVRPPKKEHFEKGQILDFEYSQLSNKSISLLLPFANNAWANIENKWTTNDRNGFARKGVEH